MTDDDYVRLCLGGSPEMFRHLVLRYESALIKHLAGRLGNEDEAAEAAQETMVRSYFALHRLKKAGSFFPWLLGIADRVALEMRRSRRRRPTPLDFEAVSALTQPDLPVHDSQSDPELGRAVAELPEAYKQVILDSTEVNPVPRSVATSGFRSGRSPAVSRGATPCFGRRYTHTSKMRRSSHDLFAV